LLCLFAQAQVVKGSQGLAQLSFTGLSWQLPEVLSNTLAGSLASQVLGGKHVLKRKYCNNNGNRQIIQDTVMKCWLLHVQWSFSVPSQPSTCAHVCTHTHISSASHTYRDESNSGGMWASCTAENCLFPCLTLQCVSFVEEHYCSLVGFCKSLHRPRMRALDFFFFWYTEKKMWAFYSSVFMTWFWLGNQ
jgi:hypothetical protein